ncbi:hypothetical protein H206_01331 [Candidatus Electrothrix aarhusensis]|jgi:hypothetical protein|uniref:Uncharacterized protein n=1 Tax=Candidatus Electrothrix aarhusensis TaxID=1859131 RepID=A0A3S3U8T9_9BACT|nr:hypothetical protein H206_01331 [Candidatus Electrothrix aarhusensis]
MGKNRCKAAEEHLFILDGGKSRRFSVREGTEKAVLRRKKGGKGGGGKEKVKILLYDLATGATTATEPYALFLPVGKK